MGELLLHPPSDLSCELSCELRCVLVRLLEGCCIATVGAQIGDTMDMVGGLPLNEVSTLFLYTKTKVYLGTLFTKKLRILHPSFTLTS